MNEPQLNSDIFNTPIQLLRRQIGEQENVSCFKRVNTPNWVRKLGSIIHTHGFVFDNPTFCNFYSSVKFDTMNRTLKYQNHCYCLLAGVQRKHKSFLFSLFVSLFHSDISTHANKIQVKVSQNGMRTFFFLPKTTLFPQFCAELELKWWRKVSVAEARSWFWKIFT